MKIELDRNELEVVRMTLTPYVAEMKINTIENCVAKELAQTFLHRLERVQLLMTQKGKPQVKMKLTYCESFILLLIQDEVTANMGFSFAQKIYSTLNKQLLWHPNELQK